MEIIVDDTNILIDLANTGLIKYCKKLDIQFYSTEFAIAELTDHSQIESVNRLLAEGTLIEYKFKNDELMSLVNIYREYSLTTNLTTIDCSVMLLAEKLNCRLLTNDQKLVIHAKKRGIEVNGLLWLTDRMVDDRIVSPIQMIDFLQKLLDTNVRAPQKMILERMQKYWEER